jgi:hypothetical protein
MARPVWPRTGLVAALAFVLTLPAVTTRLYAADEIEYFAFLRSLWFDHDLSFENEYQYFVESGATRDPGFAVLCGGRSRRCDQPTGWSEHAS